MPNLIQIKRSSSTTAPASLANGEIAYSYANTSNTLWIGDPRNVVPGTPLRIAGGKYAFLHQANLYSATDEGGKLTANAVVITNANNFLDQFKTNTIVIGPDGTTNAAATLVVSGTANISGNATIGGSLSIVGGTTIGGNVAFDTDTLFIDSVNNRVGILTTTPNAPLQVNGAANVQGAAYFANSTTHVGAAVFSNTVQLTSAVGFTTNVAFNTSTLFVDATNSRVGVGTTTPDATFKVNGTANIVGAVALSNTLTVTGLTTLNGDLNTTTANATTGINVGANVNVSTTKINVGNSSVNTAITATAINTQGTLDVLKATTLSNTIAVTGNATFSNTIAVTGQATFTANIVADTSTFFVDTTNHRVGIITTTPDASLSVAGTANVSGNTTIGGRLVQVANASFSNTIVVTGNATFSNTIAVTGAAQFLNTITGSANVNIDSGVLFVDTINNRVGINDATPAVALAITGSSTISANLTANNLLINADATINGNLSVNGTLTTIDTVNLVVEDPLFKLAKNNNVANSAGDTVDTGFYGVYANTIADMYTGMFRDASDGKYKLFTNLATEPTTTVDTAAASFQYATLNAYLEMSGFNANTTQFNVTANSTYAVSLVANTLTLATQLAVGSGGTGQQSFTLNGVIYGNSTSGLLVSAAGANGDVLQVISNVPAFGTLDGGTF